MPFFISIRSRGSTRTGASFPYHVSSSLLAIIIPPCICKKSTTSSMLLQSFCKEAGCRCHWAQWVYKNTPKLQIWLHRKFSAVGGLDAWWIIFMNIGRFLHKYSWKGGVRTRHVNKCKIIWRRILPWRKSVIKPQKTTILCTLWKIVSLKYR